MKLPKFFSDFLPLCKIYAISLFAVPGSKRDPVEGIINQRTEKVKIPKGWSDLTPKAVKQSNRLIKNQKYQQGD